MSESQPDVDTTADDHKVEVSSQGKHFLDIPGIHLQNAGIEQGDDVGIKPVNFNGQFCLGIHKDSSVGLSRTMRSGRHNESRNLLTIPKRVATAAGLGNCPVTYNSQGGDEKIIAVVNRSPRIDAKIEVYNVSEELMTRWKTGLYAYQIPDDIANRVPVGDSLWFWYDVLGDGFVFVLEPDEADAPEGAIELNVQHTERAQTDYLVHLPKQIGDALELSGTFMKWGHDGTRILGLRE